MTVVDPRAGPRVLIAEADPWVRDRLTEVVLSVRCDATLKMCANGQQAHEWLRDNQPDLVIAAWELPGIDGLSLLGRVRMNRQQPPVPFILLSTRNDSASVREVVPLAPTAYLAKPLNMDSLRTRLERLLLKEGEAVTCEVAPPLPGLTLSRFLDERRELSDGGPLFVDVDAAVKLSKGVSGIDITLLEQQLRADPQITAVLIAAANSAAQHRGEPIQALGPALAMLGATQSANLVLGLALKRGAVLTDDALLRRAEHFWGVSQRTAHYASALAELLDLERERCYGAGLLHRLGDLAVVRCLQDWTLAGGELDDQLISQSLERYAAAFGSALRARWRLPIELCELIAGAYAVNEGVQTREALAMNVAAQLAGLEGADSAENVAASQSACLLKISSNALETLREEAQTSTI